MARRGAISIGIDRISGKSIADWDDVCQCMFVIFTTMLGTRVMRRTFGSAVPGLLGRNLTPSTLLNFYVAIVTAVTLWEPRLLITNFIIPTPQNSPATMRAGHIAFQIVGFYRPRALLGDMTTEPIPRMMNIVFPFDGQNGPTLTAGG